MVRLDPRWMLAASPSGIVGLGPRTALEISFESELGARVRLLDALASGTDADAVADLAGAELGEARSLIERLSSLGAVGDNEREPSPPRGHPLASAILRIDDDPPYPDLIWTAAEALVVPPGLDRAARRALLRAFIAGIEPRERRVAYGHAALWRAPTVVGDVPPQRALDAALERAGGAEGEIAVLDLARGASTSLDPADLGRIGAGRTHRLGPVTSIAHAQLGDDPPLHLVSARMALPNIAHVEPPVIGLSGKGTGPSIEAAETIARAEAAERYGTGEIAGRRLVRAREHELDAAVAGDALLRHNPRQHANGAATVPYDPDERYLWTPAVSSEGDRRWVLAEAVFNPFRDFERPRAVILAGSSGAAAHATLEEARRRALREVIERDAFMWTWVQRVSRERIAPASLPAALRSRAESLAGDGLAVDLVNLTLESEAVLLCAIHRDDLLAVGAACHPDPARAGEKALDEAALVLALAADAEFLAAPEVRTPYDHVRHHRDPGVAGRASFLHSSPDEIGLDEIAPGDGLVDSLVPGVASPLYADLSSPRTRPFHVARALVPGLVPISFGWDREPLGMPLLATPRTTADGRTLGRSLDLADAGPLAPHPFA